MRYSICREPTVEVVKEDDGSIQAEIFGDGVDIWLGGQGDIVERISNRQY